MQAGAGFSLWLRVLNLPTSVQERVKPSRRGRASPVSIRSRRPVRPCLVVNPGGETAMPWALRRNLPAQTISPAPCAFLAEQILCACRFSTLLRPLRGATRPSPPIGSQQGRTGAALIYRKEIYHESPRVFRRAPLLSQAARV